MTPACEYCGVLWSTVEYCGVLWSTYGEVVDDARMRVLWSTVEYCGVL